jgi:response regulator NasT
VPLDPAPAGEDGAAAAARPAPVTADTGAPLRVLLIDDGAVHIEHIRRELSDAGHLVVGVIDRAVTIHDSVLRLQPDIVIVDAESPGRDTLENLATLSSRHPRPVVVFSEDGSDGPMEQALKAGVSAYVIAGLQPQRVNPVLKVAMARFAQDRALRAQLEDAQLKLSERQHIERAKGLLMQEFGLGEEQAYAHLRKLAMDRGQRLGEVAQRLVEAHALLKTPPRA